MIARWDDDGSTMGTCCMRTCRALDINTRIRAYSLASLIIPSLGNGKVYGKKGIWSICMCWSPMAIVIGIGQPAGICNAGVEAMAMNMAG